MTIQELCDRLSQFPPDTPVVISGYEGGLNDITIIESLEIQLNVNTESFYGAHSSYFSKDSGKQILTSIYLGGENHNHVEPEIEDISPEKFKEKLAKLRDGVKKIKKHDS